MPPAKISDKSYGTLVDKSRAIAKLQEPLIRRPDLPDNLAQNMCAWVSDALKIYIEDNYHLAPERVDDALVQATTALPSEAPGPQGSARWQSPKTDRKTRRFGPAQSRLFDAGVGVRGKSICLTSPSRGFWKSSSMPSATFSIRVEWDWWRWPAGPRGHRPLGLRHRLQPVASGAQQGRRADRPGTGGSRWNFQQLQQARGIGRVESQHQSLIPWGIIRRGKRANLAACRTLSAATSAICASQ